MAWRVHLANQAIQQLHLLEGKVPALIAWTRRYHPRYYAIETGALLGESAVAPLPDEHDIESEVWQAYVNALYTYDHETYLPFVRLSGIDLYASLDGKLRLYHHTNDNELYFEKNAERTQINVEDVERFTSIGFDPDTGTIAALDERSRLHLYHGVDYIGMFDLGLERHDFLQSRVVLSRNGERIFVTDGRRIIQATNSGQVINTHDELHYHVGQLACSPNGGAIIVSDIESGVLRLYRADDQLIATHQRFAIDLVADANQIQLMADMPPINTAVTSIVAYEEGVFAFTMAGVLCTSDVLMMTELPRPQALI